MYTIIGIFWFILGCISLYSEQPLETTAVCFLVAAVFFLVGEISYFRAKIVRHWEEEYERVRESNCISENEGD